MRGRVALGVVVTVGAILSACSGDDGAESTTTTTMARISTTTTTTESPDPQVTSSTTGPTGTRSEATFPAYEIARRDVDQPGDTVVVLLDPTTYETLTDIDLQNIVADVVEQFPPVFIAHVVDAPEAVDAVLLEEPDEAVQSLLAEHYLVRLEEGVRMVFTGPFASVGVSILGS